MKTMNMKTMKIINSTIVASSMLLVGSLQAASDWTNADACEPFFILRKALYTETAFYGNIFTVSDLRSDYQY